MNILALEKYVPTMTILSLPSAASKWFLISSKLQTLLSNLNSSSVLYDRRTPHARAPPFTATGRISCVLDTAAKAGLAGRETMVRAATRRALEGKARRVAIVVFLIGIGVNRSIEYQG